MPVEKFELTREQFGKMLPNGESAGRLDEHWPFINLALEFGRVTTAVRAAMFFAQLAHESGEYRYMEEIASGRAYEGRADLGNTQPGDGVKFKGHGPIQITGRSNHKLCGEALGLDLIADPTLITQPEWGTMSAAWFWREGPPPAKIDMNEWADGNSLSAFRQCTRRINGGYNGLEDRLKYWSRAKTALGIA